MKNVKYPALRPQVWDLLSSKEKCDYLWNQQSTVFKHRWLLCEEVLCVLVRQCASSILLSSLKHLYTFNKFTLYFLFFTYISLGHIVLHIRNSLQRFWFSYIFILRASLKALARSLFLHELLLVLFLQTKKANKQTKKSK